MTTRYNDAEKKRKAKALRLQKRKARRKPKVPAKKRPIARVKKRLAAAKKRVLPARKKVARKKPRGPASRRVKRPAKKLVPKKLTRKLIPKKPASKKPVSKKPTRKPVSLDLFPRVRTRTYVRKIREKLGEERSDPSLSLARWRGGHRELDTHRSTGASIRFTVRRRVTPASIDFAMGKVRDATFKLERLHYPLWLAHWSLVVIGKRHPELPCYRPIVVKGLAKGEECYVTYETTGAQRSEEDVRRVMRGDLEKLLGEEDSYVSLEQVSVSTFRTKGPGERTAWLRGKEAARKERARTRKRREGRAARAATKKTAIAKKMVNKKNARKRMIKKTKKKARTRKR